MKAVAALLLLAAACVEEHGSRPDPVAPALHGTWGAGADTLAFDQADRTMTWSNGEAFATGTWRITEPNRLELICPTCPFEDGVLPIRITADHLLIDGVMEGWQAAEPNAVWSGLVTSREPVCPSGGRTFSRMITLSATEAVDRSTTSCSDTITASGPWLPTPDGFTFTASGETRELFLIDNAISQRRWMRE